MVSVTIRDVPEEARNELAARASQVGQSLQEYLRSSLIALASKPDPKVLMRRVLDRKSRVGSSLNTEAILEHRDADRR